MRHGYSMLLADAVAADELGYGDCEEFLVVCPVCKEGVFKALRGETHYLSHYISGLASRECELRVGKMSTDEVRQAGRASSPKGQSIDAFVDRFREVVVTGFTTPGLMLDGFSLDGEIKALIRNPNFNWWHRQLTGTIWGPECLRYSGTMGGLVSKVDDAELGADSNKTRNIFESFCLGLLNGEFALGGHVRTPTFRLKGNRADVLVSYARAMGMHFRTHHGRESSRYMLAAIMIMIIRPNINNPAFVDQLTGLLKILPMWQMESKPNWFSVENEFRSAVVSLMSTMDGSKMKFMHSMTKTGLDVDIPTAHQRSDNSRKELRDYMIKFLVFELFDVLAMIAIGMLLQMPNARRYLVRQPRHG